ncbi:hypothetical protein V5O48_012739 [Marasmius crinis-equi]|uniref:Nephrocystin 3-like N-terminal domain-containing protein n=1 Tax=Marasmius crinis-equi TaxID=585013 RepID=A0ABR3F1Z6_9AGAR
MQAPENVVPQHTPPMTSGPVSSYFTNARIAKISRPNLSNVYGHQINNNYADPTEFPVLQILAEKLEDVGATHNSEARYPPPRCYPATREEVRKRLIEHIRRRRGGYLYWLSGYVGVGKSAIAQSISEESERSEDLVASFFFSRNHPKRSSPTFLFLAVAYGLARSIEEIKKQIGKTIESNPMVLEASLETQFLELVVKPCRALAAGQGWSNRPRLVVIDGLDECEGADAQKRVLSTISNALRDTEGLPLEFMICSRPEPTIKEFLSSTFPVDSNNLTSAQSSSTVAFANSTQPLFWWYRLEDDMQASRDIKLFLRERFAQIRASEKFKYFSFPDPWPSEEVVEKLTWKSSLQFIYPVTVVGFLEDEYCDPRERLEIVRGLRPPDPDEGRMPFSVIDILYRYILSVNRDQKRIITILGFVLHSPNHTLRSPRNIGFLLGLSEGKVAVALRGMHSVLDISNSEIRILHASFTDFLEDPSRSGDFHIDSAYSHSFILTRVLQRVNESWPKLQSDPEKILDQDSVIRQVLIGWAPLLKGIVNPTQDHLSELENLDVSAVYRLVMQRMDFRVKWSEIWYNHQNDLLTTVSWLKKAPKKGNYERLISHLQGGFHIRCSSLSVLNALLKRLYAHAQPPGFWFPYYYRLLGIGAAEDRLNGRDSFYAGDYREYTCTHPDAIAPIECSPGVYYVRDWHPASITISSLVNLIPSEGTPEVILALFTDRGFGIGPLIDRPGPLPVLLPLVHRILPEIFNYSGELWNAEEILRRLLEWLKSFPEEHRSDITSLVRDIEDRALRMRSEDPGYENVYRQLSELDPEDLNEGSSRLHAQTSLNPGIEKSKMDGPEDGISADNDSSGGRNIVGAAEPPVPARGGHSLGGQTAEIAGASRVEPPAQQVLQHPGNNGPKSTPKASKRRLWCCGLC